MKAPLTNVHAHVFNSQCAPDRFLRILPSKLIRLFARRLKTRIESKSGRRLIRFLGWLLNWRNRKTRKEFQKYVSFLEIATQRTQLKIFQHTLKSGLKYDPAVRIVGLTMNMDYMDSMPSMHMKGLATQLEEIKDIKRYYPTHFFPFLGIDPRHRGGEELTEWARFFFETGVPARNGKVYPYFSGIKLYPALGFFPFDPHLDDLYRFAEQNEIPIMTHCTRVGSQYIGNLVESLIPEEPEMIMPDTPSPNAKKAREEIIARIKRFREKGWIENSKMGNNDSACDLFGHPQNFVPVLEKYPKLKICLAHMGGSEEIPKEPPSALKEIREADGYSWFELIKSMMRQYPSLYTDISYTLADLNKKAIRERIIEFLNTKDNSAEAKPLADRVLFGTDFFMTEREGAETELYDRARKELNVFWDALTRQNPQNYLQQPL